MRARRGEFYIYQQHDDQVSPTYVADLVEAALRWPKAAVCFADIEYTGLKNWSQHGFSLVGPPIERALSYLEHLDCVPFRGLIRGSIQDATAGLLLSEFDPFDSFGTEIRFLAELALLGEFRFVSGPTYYKRLHGKNLYLKREKWSEQQKQMAWACLGGWMIEVIAPAGGCVEERRRLFHAVLGRFLVPRDPWRLLRIPTRRLALTHAKALNSARSMVEWLKRSDTVVRAVGGRWMLYDVGGPEHRALLLHMIFDRLKSGGRLDPGCMQSTWEELEDASAERFGLRTFRESLTLILRQQ
jgi:hypothetical protein